MIVEIPNINLYKLYSSQEIRDCLNISHATILTLREAGYLPNSKIMNSSINHYAVRGIDVLSAWVKCKRDKVIKGAEQIEARRTEALKRIKESNPTCYNKILKLEREHEVIFSLSRSRAYQLAAQELYQLVQSGECKAPILPKKEQIASLENKQAQ